MKRSVLPLVWCAISAVALGGCPGDDTNPGDGGTGSASETGSDGPCTPGETIDCACTDGSMGTQVCNDAGDAFGSCMCDGTGTGTSTTSASGSGTTATTEATTGDDDSTGTGAPACMGDHPIVEGDVRFCERDACYCKPSDSCFAADEAQACCDDAVLCGGQACEGSHPIVEGDMRSCDPGFCYCGNFDAEPVLDVCFAEAQADACCPVELECY